jgi:hypothetical protein
MYTSFYIYTGEITEKEYSNKKMEHDFDTRYLYRIANEAVYVMCIYKRKLIFTK